MGFADAFVKFCSDGERLCCAREFQNLIDESVHPLIKSRIDMLGAPCSYNETSVKSAAGGEIFYRGLSRNPTGIQSMFGVKRMWIEEGQSLSERTLDALTPTIRETGSEIWISMNRGSSKDPVSQRFLKPYEKKMKNGVYEDEDILIVEINYWDNPWFPDVLEQERRLNYANMSRAKYLHVWEGHYSDTVEDAIIEPEWFDACVDAHKKLGFEPLGQERVAYDPADTGDAKAVAYSHGSVVLEAMQTEEGEIDTATDWATSFANDKKPDTFTWDADGMGMGLKRQIAEAFEGKKLIVEAFQGSGGVDDPDKVYDRLDDEVKEPKTNKETFANKRAQYYWMLRDRMFKTWQAVEKGKYHNPDELISFSSEIEDLDQLRSELCRIPRKYVPSGRIQLLGKPDMKKQEIDSPNMADAVMMLQRPIEVRRDRKKLRKRRKVAIA